MDTNPNPVSHNHIFLSLKFIFQVECYDHDDDGSHDLIGSFETTMKRLQEASRTSPVWPRVRASLMWTSQQPTHKASLWPPSLLLPFYLIILFWNTIVMDWNVAACCGTSLTAVIESTNERKIRWRHIHPKSVLKSLLKRNQFCSFHLIIVSFIVMKISRYCFP